LAYPRRYGVPQDAIGWYQPHYSFIVNCYMGFNFFSSIFGTAKMEYF